jgi:hypothetical protein
MMLSLLGGHWKFRLLLVIGTVLLVCALSTSAVLFQPRPMPELPPLPHPNGYDDLLEAGMLVQSAPPAYNFVDTETLRAFVNENRAALERTRQGLCRESVVTIDFTYASMATHLQKMAPLRLAAAILAAASVLAERDGRLNDAADSSLDSIRFGPHIARGGLLVDATAGTSYTTAALERLGTFSDQLDADTCRKVIETLQEVDSQFEPIEIVIQRENAWALASADWRTRIPMIFSADSLDAMKQPIENTARMAELRNRTHLRLRITHLAIRMYKLAHGKNPATLAVLVPDPLKAVPVDPFNGRPFLYKREPPHGKSYVLRSPGLELNDEVWYGTRKMSVQHEPKRSDPTEPY